MRLPYFPASLATLCFSLPLALEPARFASVIIIGPAPQPCIRVRGSSLVDGYSGFPYSGHSGNTAVWKAPHPGITVSPLHLQKLHATVQPTATSALHRPAFLPGTIASIPELLLDQPLERSFFLLSSSFYYCYLPAK